MKREQVWKEKRASTQRASANQGEASVEREKAPEVQSRQKEVARQKGKCTRVCAHAELLRQLFSFVTSVLPGVLSDVGGCRGQVGHVYAVV